MVFLLAAFAALLTNSVVATAPVEIYLGPHPAPLANGTALRIMPLGASITWGQASSDGNGYRGVLRTALVSGGNPVNMVGSQQHGAMTDNDNEGWPGYVIDQVYAKANDSVPQWKPNVILVNAGTNDCSQDNDIVHAGDRMRAMVEHLFEMSPRATVLLSSLIVNKDSNVEANVLAVNVQYRALAADLKARGRRLVFVDMHGPDGPLLEDMADSTHPNDEGYLKMGALWYKGLVDASKDGFIVAPEPVYGVPDDGGA